MASVGANTDNWTLECTAQNNIQNKPCLLKTTNYVKAILKLSHANVIIINRHFWHIFLTIMFILKL